MTETATRQPRYTLADHCASAIHFGSGATGAPLDFDLPPGFEMRSFTSDRVPNQVDYYYSIFDQIHSVIVIEIPLAYRLLPPPPTGLCIACGSGLVEPVARSSVEAPNTPSLSMPPLSGLRAPSALAPAEVAARLREIFDLPVGNVAAMVGIGRRQFYNLLEGGATSPETELRLRHLLDRIEQLAAVVGEDPEQLRSALLTPVGPGRTSLYEAALRGDEAELRETLDALLNRIERRGLRQVRRPLPHPGAPASSRASQRAREALAGMPTLDLGDGEKGDGEGD